MITYPISTNLYKKIWLQWYPLYNSPSCRSSHRRCSVKKGVLRNFAKFTGRHLWHSLFFNKVAGWGNCFWSFSCLLLKIVFHHSHTKKKFFSKFHFVWNKKKKKKKEMKIPWWSSNIYFFARVSICLTSKILKEIWQMVIWTGNMFKENFMLQFSCLERNFPREKFLGGEHLTSSSAKMA